MNGRCAAHWSEDHQIRHRTLVVVTRKAVNRLWVNYGNGVLNEPVQHLDLRPFPYHVVQPHTASAHLRGGVSMHAAETRSSR